MKFAEYLQEVEMTGQHVTGQQSVTKQPGEDKKIEGNPQLGEDIDAAMELASLLSNSKASLPDGFFKYKFEYGLMQNKYPAVLKTTIVSGRPFNIKDIFAIVINGKVFGTKNSAVGVAPDMSHGIALEKFKSAIVKK